MLLLCLHTLPSQCGRVLVYTRPHLHLTSSTYCEIRWVVAGFQIDQNGSGGAEKWTIVVKAPCREVLLEVPQLFVVGAEVVAPRCSGAS
jgi:hypothetical protein